MDTREFSVYFMGEPDIVDGVDGVVEWFKGPQLINLVNEEELRDELEVMKVQQIFLYGITGVCYIKRIK